MSAPPARGIREAPPPTSAQQHPHRIQRPIRHRRPQAQQMRQQRIHVHKSLFRLTQQRHNPCHNTCHARHAPHSALHLDDADPDASNLGNQVTGSTHVLQHLRRTSAMRGVRHVARQVPSDEPEVGRWWRRRRGRWVRLGPGGHCLHKPGGSTTQDQLQGWVVQGTGDRHSHGCPCEGAARGGGSGVLRLGVRIAQGEGCGGGDDQVTHHTSVGVARLQVPPCACARNIVVHQCQGGTRNGEPDGNGVEGRRAQGRRRVPQVAGVEEGTVRLSAPTKESEAI